MNIEEFERDIHNKLKASRTKNLQTLSHNVFEHIQNEWQMTPEHLSMQELKVLIHAIIAKQTQQDLTELEELIAEKEQIERHIERTRKDIQSKKLEVFESVEEELNDAPQNMHVKLHQIKMQSIDLLDMLQETTESALLAALEKGVSIEESIEEFSKELTYETLSESVLSSIRIRKVLSTIISTAIDVADATPNQAHEILYGTLKGTRKGLTDAIERFKKQLLFMPDEAKLLLVKDYDALQDLSQSDTLFNHIIDDHMLNKNSLITTTLKQIKKEMHFDMDELIHISKDAADTVKLHLSAMAKEAMLRSSKMLKSQTASDAKRLGVQAISAAKSALEQAIKKGK